MEASKKDKLKLKIKALLSKTTDNGATKAEAISAINKAQSLMEENLILESDLNSSVLGEKCILKEHPRNSMKHKEVFITSYLANLFFCQTYHTNKNVFFFGFEQDADLCCYFYDFIVESALSDLYWYKETQEYEDLKKESSANSIVSNFVKGYLLTVCRKIQEIYTERQKVRSGKGVVVVDEKMAKVKREFQNLGLNLKTVKSNIRGTNKSFQSGSKRGGDLSISQGVSEGKRNSIKRLS
jgi:hypothetical protein